MNEQNGKRQPRRRGGGPGGRYVGGEKPQDFRGAVGRLLRYLGGYRALLIVALALAACGTAFSVTGPTIMGNAITEIYNGLIGMLSGGPGIDMSAIFRILMLMLAIYIISAVMSLIQGFIMVWITQRITHKLRTEISEKIHRMPMATFENDQHGEILSIITNDVDTLSQAMQQSVSQMITSVATVVGVLIMMLRIDWAMTGIALIILPVAVLLVMLVVRKSQKYFRAQQEHLGHLNGKVEETFSGIQVIQAFNGEEEAVREFTESNEELYRVGWRSQFLSGLMQPIMNMVSNIGYVAVAILGAYFAAQGRITVGNIATFLTYTRNFTQPITQLAQVTNMFQSMAAAAERVFRFLDREEENQKAEHHAPATVSDIRGQVTFDHVRFGYNDDKIVIGNFSARVDAGKKIAIVGPTGAGKTTMVKLLMRFYDVLDGSIQVDGHDIRDFDRTELREIFGMVLQDTWLFSDTIMENIRYGKLEATDEQVIEAAKAAHVHHFITTLPDGYNMVLNEEASNISQGQKQLLTIARAILADNRILILDEATSSVDTRTEALIQKAMDNLMEGRTSFVIAHRLSTIRNADLILVMRGGDIVEQGTHDQLLEQGGFYAQLWSSQFQDEE